MPDVQPASPDAVIKLVREHDVRSVDLQFTDVAGMVKTVTIDADHLPAAFEHGVWFDGSAVEGFARVAESDMYLKPDASTFAVIPWEAPNREVGRTARLFCDVYTPNGQPFAGDPRGALRQALELAESMGMRYVVAPELEFYLFHEPAASGSFQLDDQAGYFDASGGVARTIRKRVNDALRAMGIIVETSHHEVGGGQHELDLKPLDALKMADAIVTARMAVRTIARQEGRFATFMPKPITDAPGSGCTSTNGCATSKPMPTASPTPPMITACLVRPKPFWPASSPTRAPSAPCWRRWSTATSA